jgi:hypothetical protein
MFNRALKDKLDLLDIPYKKMFLEDLIERVIDYINEWKSNKRR